VRPPDQRHVLRMLPLLVAGLVLSEAAAAAITLTTDEPVFEVCLHLAILAGFVLSYRAVVRKRDNLMMAGLVAVGAVTLCGISYVRVLPVVLLYPDEILSAHESTVAALFGWLLVAWALLQSRRDCLFLPVVTSLAIFGLMGTLNLNVEFVAAFVIYLFAAAYAWGYDHLLGLRIAADAEGDKQVNSWLRLGRTQLSATALLLFVVLIVSAGLGNGLYRATPNLWGRWKSLYRSWNWTGAIFQGTFMFTNNIRVGTGPVRLTDLVMLKVKADQPALWCGRVYDKYTGRGWQRSIENPTRYELPTNPRQPNTYYVPNWREYKGRRMLQTFEISNVTSSGLLAAAHPIIIRTTPLAGFTGIRAPRVQQDAYGSLQTLMVMTPGTTYEVVSMVPDFTAEQLRAAGEEYPSEFFEDLFVRQYPLAVEVELKELVEQVTANCETPYDKVQAILEHLSADYLYTLSPPCTPAGHDAVVYFLKDSKRGACDLFASAAVMMCRLAGVPARLATGYAEGTWDPDEQAYIVRGTDAHAWIEVYYPGYGWVPYNPQAAGELETQNLLSLLKFGQVRLVLGKALRGVLVAGAAVALLYLMFSALFDPHVLWRSLLNRSVRPAPWRKLAAEQVALCRALLATTGQRYAPSLTPQEVLQTTSQANLASLELTEVADAFAWLYQLRYAPVVPSDAELEALRQQLRRLRRRIQRAGR